MGIPFSLFNINDLGLLSIIIKFFKSRFNFFKSLIKLLPNSFIQRQQCSLYNLNLHDPFLSIKSKTGLAY